jgi:hypothetical protein
MTKDIFIISCYTNTDKKKKILNQCIDSLIPYYDIILVSHYPIAEETLKKVKYFIYSEENTPIDVGSLLIHQQTQDLFYQIHIRNAKHNSYAVYKSIYEAVHFLSKNYTHFYFIADDCIISEKDLEKIKALKEVHNKKACMFNRDDGFIHTLCFYSEIKFFLNNFPFFNTLEDYLNECKNIIIDKYPVLEWLFYFSLIKNNTISDVNLITVHPSNYFSNSEIDISSYTDNGFNHPIYVLKLKNTNRIFLLYTNNKITRFDEEKIISISIDSKHLFNLDAGNYIFWSEIFPENDLFSIKVNEKEKTFNKTELLNDDLNFISFDK